jgi:hypothetical protein
LAGGGDLSATELPSRKTLEWHLDWMEGGMKLLEEVMRGLLAFEKSPASVDLQHKLSR